MELNTINKTGTWSETADRINSNFSKISIEVEEIKQNGGGGSYVAKASTTNPPLWCWTDNAGNRFTFNDGGYCLTGEVNTAEYDVWAEKGEPGKDGTDGKDGVYRQEVYLPYQQTHLCYSLGSPRRSDNHRSKTLGAYIGQDNRDIFGSVR